MFNIFFLKKIDFYQNLKLNLNLLFDSKIFIEEYLNLISFPFVKNYKKSIILLKEDYLRLKSDYNNFKKRSSDELSKSYKYAIEDFSEDLLPIVDSLESALSDKSRNIEKLLEGIRLISKLFFNVFEKNNIKIILPIINEKFDPYKHMAISAVNFGNSDNTIFNVLQKGYSIFDRIIRPALVVVNKV